MGLGHLHQSPPKLLQPLGSIGQDFPAGNDVTAAWACYGLPSAVSDQGSRTKLSICRTAAV